MPVENREGSPKPHLETEVNARDWKFQTKCLKMSVNGSVDDEWVIAVGILSSVAKNFEKH
jgi:hypothetical protein